MGSNRRCATLRRCAAAAHRRTDRSATAHIRQSNSTITRDSATKAMGASLHKQLNYFRSLPGRRHCQVGGIGPNGIPARLSGLRGGGYAGDASPFNCPAAQSRPTVRRRPQVAAHADPVDHALRCGHVCVPPSFGLCQLPSSSMSASASFGPQLRRL